MNKNIGSDFNDFLVEEGIYDETVLLALKKTIADDFAKRMKSLRINRTTLAKRMNTSRTLVNRLLDPADSGVTLATVSRASEALNLNLLVALKERDKKQSRTKRR